MLVSSPNKDRNAVHWIAAVALRIPETCYMRLHDASRVSTARPDLEVAIRGQFHRRGPALPIVFVLRIFKFGLGPGRTKVGGNVHLLDCVVAGPGSAP